MKCTVAGTVWKSVHFRQQSPEVVVYCPVDWSDLEGMEQSQTDHLNTYPCAHGLTIHHRSTLLCALYIHPPLQGEQLRGDMHTHREVQRSTAVCHVKKTIPMH